MWPGSRRWRGCRPSVAAIGTMAVPVIGVVASAVALGEPLGIGHSRRCCSRWPAWCWRRGHEAACIGPRAWRKAYITPLGLAFLAVTSVGWGLNFPIMKNLLSEWPPLSSRGLSGLVGAAALALFALARRQSLSRAAADVVAARAGVAADDRRLGRLHGLALLWLNASEAAVLGISVPVWVALLAWPILGERLSPLRAVSLAVALAGIAVLIGGHGLEASFAKLPRLPVRAGSARSASRSAPC